MTKRNSRIDSTRTETIYAAFRFTRSKKNEVNKSDRIVNLFNYGDKFGNSVNGTRSRSSFEQSLVDFEQTLLIPNFTSREISGVTHRAKFNLIGNH